MNTSTPARIRAGDLFPPMELPSAPEGRTRRLRTASRDALVLLLVPRETGPWDETLAAIADAMNDIEQWYARIRIVVPADLEEATRLRERLGGRVSVLADPEGATWERLGIAPDYAAFVVADRYGQVYEVVEAQAGEPLPGPDEIEQWTTFLATQCPECGVIDEPGHGDWTVR